MKNTRKQFTSLFIIFVFAGLFFSFSGVQQAYASFQGLDHVRVTGGNEITVTYEYTLDNNVYTSYGNLGGALMGREITGGVGNTGENSIVLTFDGPPVPANTTGTIDIDSTVTWDVEPGGFVGTQAYEVVDGQSPTMFPSVKVVPPGFSGITKLYFFFSEPIATSSITTTTIVSALDISNGHTFGTEGNGLSLSWNSSATRLEVSLGSDASIEEEDTVTVSSQVTDVAGNQSFSYADATISFFLPTPRNLYFNGAVDGSWSDLENWWEDEAFTVPANSIPNMYDRVFIYNNVSSYFSSPPVVEEVQVINSSVSIDLVVFNSLSLTGESFYGGATLFGDIEVSDLSTIGFAGPGLSFSTTHVIGNATFNAPTTANYGTIYGDATFSGEYGNAGLIFGTVEFNDTTSNPGIIYGNVVFRDSTFNASFGLGLIYGNVDVYAPAQNPLGGEVSGTITYHGYDFDGGTGTAPEDPYFISTCAQLQLMDDYLDAHFELTQDIDCSESATWNENVDEWVDGVVGGELIPDSYASVTNSAVTVVNNGYYGFSPIGTSANPFTGSLDGDGYAISNLWIFRKGQDEVGLFGKAVNADIYNLGLHDSNIVGRESVGGIVGSMEDGVAITITLEDNMVRAYLAYEGGGFAGEMTDVQASTITNTDGFVHGSGNIIGGIVGRLTSSLVVNSHSSADVDGGEYIGGFVGYMTGGLIDTSYATGNVRSDRLEYPIIKTGYNAGGFVGHVTEGTIENAYATGDVDISGSFGGGFAGSINNFSVIENAFATGNVTGIQEPTHQLPNSIGGFAGEIYQSNISHAYATGDVVNVGPQTGGFSGSSGCASVIAYSYALGDVTGDDFVGGFTGNDECMGPASTFSQVFATGDVTGDEHVGGFAGKLSVSTVNDGYTSGSVAGNSYVGGFAGELYYTDLANVYSRSAVASLGDEFIGSFVGKNFNDGEAIEGFWDNAIAYIFSDCGTGVEAECIGVEGKNAIEMTTQSTFEDAGYDFEDVWVMGAQNDGYPYFAFGIDPRVSSVTPSQGATTVSTTTEITIQFSQPMNTSLFPEVTSGPCGESCPLFNQSWINMGTALVLTKSGGPFAFGTTYTISVDGAQNEAGVTVTDPYAWSFTTEDEPAPPVVVKSRRGGGGGSSSVQARVKHLESWGNTTAAEKLRQQHPAVFSTSASTQTSVSIPGATTLLVRDLTLGLLGADIKTLQTLLIAQGHAIPAGPTGYFGTQTKAALSAYQAKNGIVPAVGYFGPLTRAQMKAAGVAGVWW